MSETTPIEPPVVTDPDPVPTTVPVPTTPPYDPCVAATKMREALQRIAMGESVKGVRYRNGEEERQTDFNAANTGELRMLLREAEDACHLATFGRPRRAAIRFSGRMCRSPFGGGM